MFCIVLLTDYYCLKKNESVISIHVNIVAVCVFRDIKVLLNLVLVKTSKLEVRHELYICACCEILLSVKVQNNSLCYVTHSLIQNLCNITVVCQVGKTFFTTYLYAHHVQLKNQL